MSEQSRTLPLLLIAAMLPFSCSRRPSDETIATQIKASLFSDPSLRASNLQVAVRDGQVTLSGTVPGSDLQLRAFKLAYGTPGVINIHDQMAVVMAPPAPRDPLLVAAENKLHLRAQKQSQLEIQERAPQLPPTPQVSITTPQPTLAVYVEAPKPSVVFARTAPPPPVVISPETYEPPVVDTPPVLEFAPAPALPAFANHSTSINAAGATIPQPIVSQWFAAFQRMTGVSTNYQAIGSGGGLRQLRENTIDVAVVDHSTQLPPKTLEFPVVLDGVAVVANIPGCTRPIRLSREALAGIFLGRIQRWNDPVLAVANPGINLPSLDVIVLHRSEGSTETIGFTRYLSAISEEWRTLHGAGANVNWPMGLGAKGNEGIAMTLKQTPGAIGYVELRFATQNKMTLCEIQNASGQYTKPGPASLAAAVSGSSELLNLHAPEAYAIPVAFSALIRDRIDDPEKRKAITGLLAQILSTGQESLAPAGYAPIPWKFAEVKLQQLKHLH